MEDLNVEIEDVGCIEHFTLTIPGDKPGGVVVLRGDNGGGKSTALDIVRVLLAGKGKLTARDGQKRGSVSGLGGDITVGGTTRRSGEVEVPSIEGKFDLADVVEPEGKTIDVRETRRQKALISLTGVKADAELYYPLLGGREQLEAVITPEQLKTDDAVELAGRITRGLQEKARSLESEQQHAESHATAALEQGKSVDTTLPDDAETLQQALLAAVSKQSKLNEQAKAYDSAAAAANTAKAKLVELGNVEKAVNEAQGAYDSATERLGESRKAVLAIAEEVAKAKERLLELERKAATIDTIDLAAVARVETTKTALENAKLAAKSIDQLTAKIAESGTLPNPTGEEVEAADHAVEEAKAAQELGVRIREAKKKLTEAEQHKAKAEELAKQAKLLRDAAAKVDGILTSQIPPGPLSIHKGYMVVSTDRDERALFDECSPGEKYRFAIPYAVQTVGEGGVFVLPQSAWQDLQPKNRLIVAGICAKHKVWMVTGIADDGELRQEVISPEPEPEKKPAKKKAK